MSFRVWLYTKMNNSEIRAYHGFHGMLLEICGLYLV